MTRIVLNVGHKPLLIGIQRTFELLSKQIAESDDGVQRSPQLMAHAGEEFALETVRSLQLTILFFQPLVRGCELGRKLLVHGVNSRLGLPAIGNIPDDRHNPRTIRRANRAETDL